MRVCARVYACVHAAGEGGGREWGEKRGAVILPGWVPEALVKPPRGLIIINREGRHDLRYKLSAALERRYGYFRVYFSPPVVRLMALLVHVARASLRTTMNRELKRSRNRDWTALDESVEDEENFRRQ